MAPKSPQALCDVICKDLEDAVEFAVYEALRTVLAREELKEVTEDILDEFRSQCFEKCRG